MTNLEKAIVKMHKAEEAYKANPSHATCAPLNAANEEWQIALYEAGEHPAYN